MVQERFLYLKEINLKQLLIFSLILSLNIASNEVLNKFNSLIKKDLYFSQEIETNTTDKSFSEGSIERYGENIEVIIEKPVREKYIIKNNEIFDFIYKRLSRTYLDIYIFVEKLDRLSLEKKRQLTIPLIKEII